MLNTASGEPDSPLHYLIKIQLPSNSEPGPVSKIIRLSLKLLQRDLTNNSGPIE